MKTKIMSFKRGKSKLKLKVLKQKTWMILLTWFNKYLKGDKKIRKRISYGLMRAKKFINLYKFDDDKYKTSYTIWTGTWTMSKRIVEKMRIFEEEWRDGKTNSCIRGRT